MAVSRSTTVPKSIRSTILLSHFSLIFATSRLPRTQYRPSGENSAENVRPSHGAVLSLERVEDLPPDAALREFDGNPQRLGDRPPIAVSQRVVQSVGHLSVELLLVIDRTQDGVEEHFARRRLPDGRLSFGLTRILFSPPGSARKQALMMPVQRRDMAAGCSRVSSSCSTFRNKSEVTSSRDRGLWVGNPRATSTALRTPNHFSARLQSLRMTGYAYHIVPYNFYKLHDFLWSLLLFLFSFLIHLFLLLLFCILYNFEPSHFITLRNII